MVMENNRLVYIASAIDLNKTGQSVAEEISRVLTNVGIVTYKPWVVFSHVKAPVAKGKGASIRDANLSVVESSAALVAIIDPSIFSFGTCVDIMAANDSGIPVGILLLGTAPIPAYLDGFTVFRGADSLIAWAYEIVTGQTGSLSLERAVLSGTITADSPTQVEGEPPVALTRVPVSTDEGHPVPSIAHFDDAGIDLYVKGNHDLEAGHTKDIPMGTKIALPSHCWGLLIGRSSTFHNHGLFIPPAVIDAGWRGDLTVTVRNDNGVAITIKDQQRIAQFVIVSRVPVYLHHVEELPEGSRGEQGFGSSGE